MSTWTQRQTSSTFLMSLLSIDGKSVSDSEYVGQYWMRTKYPGRPLAGKEIGVSLDKLMAHKKQGSGRILISSSFLPTSEELRTSDPRRSLDVRRVWKARIWVRHAWIGLLKTLCLEHNGPWWAWVCSFVAEMEAWNYPDAVMLEQGVHGTLLQSIPARAVHSGQKCANERDSKVFTGFPKKWFRWHVQQNRVNPWSMNEVVAISSK